jgi:prepilin-type N-terminal cleavage/methylation domain-containing protein
MKKVQVSPRCPHVHGFSLLEMLLVLFLIGLMASAGLMLTEGVEDQAKYDETKRRMELMRKAIVGDPTRTVNGGPEISGFVADTGRLPGCVAELLQLGTEKTPATDPRTFESPCDNTATLTEWHIDADTGIASGWRGPYIQILPEWNGALRFRDGYGNSDASDAQNSGWIWQLYQADETLTSDADAAAIIRVQSFGLDGTQRYPAGVITDAVPANRPNPLIGKNDWQVQLPATVNVTFKNQSGNFLPALDENLVIRIYLSDLSNSIEGDDGINDYLLLDAQSLASGQETIKFKLSTPPEIPIGTRAYAVVCYKAPPTAPSDFVIFDGDCGADNVKPDTSNIRTFGAIPRQNLILNLDWIIP